MLIIYFLLGLLLVLFLICWIVAKNKKAKYRKRENDIAYKKAPISADEETENRAIENLKKVLTFQTVAEQQLKDKTQFEEMHAYLKVAYPLVYKTLAVQLIEGQNICYKWEGSNPNHKPILLMAHQDVVEAGDLSKWKYPPFAGKIADGYLYGRGTIDIKSQITSILESFETLIRKGFVPKNTIYAAFSENEEIFGEGAKKLVNYFKECKIEFDLVLDEGGAVSENFLKMIDKPVAVIGVSEKTSVNFTLEVNKKGGHSSTPNNPTSMGILAHAISEIETHQEKSGVYKPMENFLEVLGCNCKGAISLVLLNHWLFKGIILSIMKKDPQTAGFFRNTHTVTMCSGSAAKNAIPDVSKANVNIRLLPKNTVEDEIIWLKKIINDKRVKIIIAQEGEKSNVSDYKSKQYKALEGIIRNIFGDVVVTPYMMTGGSDARHYCEVSKKVYRFSPYLVNEDELSRMHNFNERISLENLKRMPEFYMQIVQYFD